MNNTLTITQSNLATYNSGVATRQNYHSSTSVNDRTVDSKVYCTYWIRHGECDYMQQGCRYRHEMPDLQTLRSIGFQCVPRWYREKMSFAAARPLRPQTDFRRMIEDVDSASNSPSSDDSSSVSSSDTAVTGRPLQGVLVPAPASMSPAKNTFDISARRTQSPYGYIGTQQAEDSPKSSIRPAPQNLLSEFEASVNPPVPNNSPELPSFCQGPLYPSEEMGHTRTALYAPTTAVLVPSSSTQSCPSPLLLGSPVSTPVKPTALLASPPPPNHHHSPEQGLIDSNQLLIEARHRNPSSTSRSTQAEPPQQAAEQTKLELEIEALKAKMAVLQQQQRQNPATQRRSIAQPPTQTGLMVSRYRKVQASTDTALEEKKVGYVRQDKGKGDVVHVRTAGKASHLRKKKGVEQDIVQVVKKEGVSVLATQKADGKAQE
jgi:hypothetical protein